MFSCVALLCLYLYACFLSGVLIETFFINKACVPVKYEGCAPRRAAARSFKQSRQVPPLPPTVKLQGRGTDRVRRTALLGSLSWCLLKLIFECFLGKFLTIQNQWTASRKI